MTAATPLAALDEAVTESGAPGNPTGEPPFTRFERARILGARALQISLGAPILLDTPADQVDPVEIAEREFAAGVIPITVRRAPSA